MEVSKTIIHSLDLFIKKYYKNRLLKGVIYAVALSVSLFIATVLLEHFNYFGTAVRTVMFWLFVVAMVVIAGYNVAIPLLKMHRFGKCISYEDAAKIVGDHFPEIKDKLLNLLQLQQMHDAPSGDLLQASIYQKTMQLKPVPILDAIDLRGNKKYLKYAVVPLLVLLLSAILVPAAIVEPTKRIVNHNTFYERPAPFAFIIENEQLEVAQQHDFTLRVAIEGHAIPAEVFVNIEGRQYKLKQLDKTHFSYLFKNVQKSTHFNLQAAGVGSAEYELVMHPSPTVLDFQVALTYPAYIGKPSEVLANEGDITVPVGTVVKWSFQTKNADTLRFYVDSLATLLRPDANGRLSLSHKCMQSFSYQFCVANGNTVSDTLKYAVSAISDARPMIVVMETLDSAVADGRRFFQGRIKDDYGFSKLEFKVVRTNTADTTIKDTTATQIGIKTDASQVFYYSVDLSELNLQPGDRLSYYFEVWDNDGIHGHKSATSQQFTVEIPSEEELENIIDRNSSDAKSKAETSMSELKKLQHDIDELMRKLIDKKELNWQDKKELQELSAKQKKLKEELNSMQQQLQENSRLEQQYKEQNEQIIEKQKELDRLFNEVMNDEMKKMMEEIDKMMQEIDKKKVQEHLDHLKQNNEDLEKMLDQNLELMKHLEMEKRVESVIKEIDKLAEKQRELAKKTAASKGKERDDLLKQQKELSNRFQEMKKELETLSKEYNQLDESINFETNKELQNKIDQAQKSAESQMNKGKQKEAAQHQQQAADDMERLSEQLAQEQMDIEQADLAEDVEAIRRLLKNLVKLSFRQEQLISQVNKTYIQDPKYQEIIASQNVLKSDFSNVEDSLLAIAKRQLPVASVIHRELSAINFNLKKSLSSLLEFNQTFYGNSKNTGVAKPMQYAMTSFNNLSLVLAESLDQMQNQMRQNQQQQKQGNCKRQGMKMKGNCSNPGNGKPSAKSMKQMQDELNKQMESLKKQLEKSGSKQQGGRKKIGDKSSMSEEFAKMAAQQEMIRRMMQEYGQEIKQQNASNGKLAREIDEMMRQMEQTETDLVNKIITQQTIKRQQQIMSRMLEHEKAEMQREKEQRRESNEAKDIYQPSQSELEKFKRLQETNIELFRTTPPTLSPYYKNKVNDYFYK